MTRDEVEATIHRQLAVIVAKVMPTGVVLNDWLLDAVDTILAAVDAYAASQDVLALAEHASGPTEALLQAERRAVLAGAVTDAHS